MSASDEQLLLWIERMASGERAALGELHAAVGPRVLALLLALCGDKALAHELLQQSFLLLWEQAPSYDRHLGPPFLWMLVVARMLAVQRMGGQSQRPEDLPVLLEDGALAELPTAQRDALIEAFFRPWRGAQNGELAAAGLSRLAELAP